MDTPRPTSIAAGHVGLSTLVRTGKSGESGDGVARTEHPREGEIRRSASAVGSGAGAVPGRPVGVARARDRTGPDTAPDRGIADGRTRDDLNDA